MTSTSVLERFHDAVLLTVTVAWVEAMADVRVDLCEEPARTGNIRITGLTLLRCPRAEPWGPSVSINGVRLQSIEGGRKRVEIEVQSGDVIEIEGDAVEVTLDE